MFVPIILGSDKTTVSVGTGDNEYYPLYLSIGNIRNNVRRAHRNGVVLVGFLAIPKSKLPFTLLRTPFMYFGSREEVRQRCEVQKIPSSTLPFIACSYTRVSETRHDQT